MAPVIAAFTIWTTIGTIIEIDRANRPQQRDWHEHYREAEEGRKCRDRILKEYREAEEGRKYKVLKDHMDHKGKNRK